MKKLMTALLALLLVLSLLPAALMEAAPLSKEELDAYVEDMLKTALIDNAYQAEATEGGYLLHFAQYTLKTDSERLSANSKILAISFDDLSDVDEGIGDLRGIKLNDTQTALLSAYPLENAALSGTREEAVLYVSGDLPGQAAVGYVKRDGQRLTQISHILYFMADNGVTSRRVCYTLKDGAVVAIEVQLTGETQTLADAKAELDAFEDLRIMTEYSAYLTDETGADAEPFGRDDLLFSGMDFLDLSPETARAVLGDDYAEEWLEDGDTFIHVMEWNAASITFLHDKQKNLLRVDTLYMDEGTLEGPRGIRVGDQQQTVLERFRFGAADASGDIIYLYGAPGDDAYATAEYVSSAQASLRYVFVAGDKTVSMTLNMENARLISVLMQME